MILVIFFSKPEPHWGIGGEQSNNILNDLNLPLHCNGHVVVVSCVGSTLVPVELAVEVSYSLLLDSRYLYLWSCG